MSRATICKYDCDVWDVYIPLEWAPRPSVLCDGVSDDEPHDAYKCEHAIMGPYGVSIWDTWDEAVDFVNGVIRDHQLHGAVR